MNQFVSKVQAHLKGLGIKCRVIQPDPAKPAAVTRAEKKVGLPFPDPLKDFYLHASDGLVCFWEKGDDMGFLRLPDLRDLVKGFKGWKELVLWMDDYKFSHVEDAKLARKTYAAMKSWLPLISEGNGNGFCLDCASKTGTIVYHQHDWYDGGTGTNGLTVAPDLQTFVARWAKVCFTPPTDHNWHRTLGKNGVRWTSRYFDPTYIMAE